MSRDLRLPFFRDQFLGILGEHGFKHPDIWEAALYADLPTKTRRQIDLCMARLKVEFSYDED